MQRLTASLKALFLSLILSTSLAFAAGIGVSKDENDVAIQGYDPVAYFVEGKAMKGNQMYSAAHKDAIYHFASAANRDAFKADPERYAPQYGGFCSMSLTLEQNLTADPKAFSVIEDKLYLTVSQDAQAAWKKDFESNRKKADAFYSDVSSD